MIKHFTISTFAFLFLALPTFSQARTSAIAGLKTAGACNDEYKANKGALKDVKERKKDFIAACRALPPGTPTPIGTAAAPAASPPTPAEHAATAPTAPRAQPTAATSAVLTTTPSRHANQPAAAGEAICGNGGYAHMPGKRTAVQFCDESEAKNHCPGQLVVWVNTKSKIYHHAGTNTYGHTKEGAYMCEADATAESDRVSKNGH